MHALWLSFIDKEIELKYQINTQQYRRWSTFKLVTFGFMVVFFIKAIQAILSSKILLFAQSLAILIYLIFQLILTKYKPKYLRLALILTNHILTIFFIAYEDRNEDSQTAMLQGVNQMAATYLLILIGEFVDGAITLINLSLFRIIWAANFSSTIQFSAIASSLLLILYINYFNYQFHKARRSQFLLTLIDTQWEKILKQLIKDNHYILIQFQEDTLSYTFKSCNLCLPLFQDADGFQNFLSQSICQKEVLKTFIYEKIKKFTSDQIQSFCESQLIFYNRKLLNTEISIFQGNQPTILLIFKDFSAINQINLDKVVKQQQLLLKIVLNITNKFLHEIQNGNEKFKCLISSQRKLIIHNLLQEIRISQNIKLLNIHQFLLKISKYYVEKQFEWQMINLNILFNIHTIQNSLALLFFLIFEESQNQKIRITFEKPNLSQDSIEITIFGEFKKEKILDAIDSLKIHFELILYQIVFKDCFILIILKENADLPFIFQKEYQIHDKC